MPFLNDIFDRSVGRELINHDNTSLSAEPWTVVDIPFGSLHLKTSRWRFGDVYPVSTPTGQQHQSELRLDASGLDSSTDERDIALRNAFTSRRTISMIVAFATGRRETVYLALQP